MNEFEHGWIDVLKASGLTPVVQWIKAGESPKNLNSPERLEAGQLFQDKSAQVFADFVGELGRDGWELVWVSGDRHYFKRQLTWAAARYGLNRRSASYRGNSSSCPTLLPRLTGVEGHLAEDYDLIAVTDPRLQQLETELPGASE